MPTSTCTSQTPLAQGTLAPKPASTRVLAHVQTAWHHLHTGLPAGWQAKVQATGLIQRKRQIGTVAQWLHLVLLYVSAGLSLRSTAFFAHLQGLAHLTDQAVRKWLLKSAPALQTLLALALRRQAPKGAGPSLRIHDGSVLCGHGAQGAQWRLHLTYDLSVEREVDVHLTTEKEGETLQYAQLRPGDIVLGDRNYARAHSLHSVVQRGAHPLVRVYLPSIRLQAQSSLHPKVLIRRARRGDCETEVEVPLQDRSIRMRLLVIPLPSQSAAQARRKLHAKARKQGKTADAKAALWAGYLCLLTTVPKSVADAHRLAQWYRLRWQVELYSKRGKSLLDLGALRKCSRELARVYILGK